MSLLNVSDLQTHFKLPKGVLRRGWCPSPWNAAKPWAWWASRVAANPPCSLLRLETPTAGHITLDGQDILPLKGAQLRGLRKRMQMIFQDPFASLNPRHSIGSILETPLQVHGLGDRSQRRRQVEQLLDRVGLAAQRFESLPA
jgi:peptide/nickel transport system ATP-binding protein